MEATVAERGQITLPKAVRDALGLTKGTKLKVEIEGGRIMLRKDVERRHLAAARPLQAAGRRDTDDVMRDLRGRAPGDPVPATREGAPQDVIAVDTSVLIDLHRRRRLRRCRRGRRCARP